jgi:hypothetical protein
MYRTIVSYFCVAKTMTHWPILSAMLCFSVPVAIADEKQDITASNALIAIIESNDTENQASQAEVLYDTVPEESRSKLPAAIAMALIYIREKRFSDAWKVLAARPKEQSSVNVGRERLKLWLLLEAGVKDTAEAQFKQLVTMTLGLEASNTDLTANCGLIGGVAGMLRADGEPIISISTLEKGKEVLLTKVQAKNATSKFEEKFAEASQWGQALQALVGRYESVGDEKAKEINSSTQAEYQRTDQKQLELRGDLNKALSEKRNLEENRSKWFKMRSAIQAELKRETPGKPRAPVAPSKPSLQRPKLPRNTPNEKENERAKQNYDRDMRAYNNAWSRYESQAKQYERDKIVYSAQVQVWDQADTARRAPLQAELQRILPEIAAAENALNEKQNEIKQGVALDLKQNTSKHEQLKRSALLSSIAFENVTSNDLKSKRLLRPSNFNLIDFQSESTRLKKTLRELR